MSIHNGKIKDTWKDHYEYGFIVMDNDEEIYFHIDNSPDLLDKKSSVTAGLPVEFEKKPSKKYPGEYEAHNVRLKSDHHVNDNTQDLSSSSPPEDDTSQENAHPKTCLILTVGTNALPIWVAWHHLKNLPEKLPHPIRVQLVHTEKTKDEMERLRTEIEKYYSKHSSDGFVKQVQTSPGDPCQVFDDITKILNGLLGETEHVHVHYTGGTQVMGVETVSAATKFDGRKKVSTSYLTIHADSGPAIMGRKLTDEGNLLINLINDTRVKIVQEDVDLNFLRFIAQLNGFEIGKFTHTYRGWSYTRPTPIHFTQTQYHLTVGNGLLTDIQSKRCREINKLIQEWWHLGTYDRSFSKFSYPTSENTFAPASNGLWKNHLFPFFMQVYDSLDWCTTTSNLFYPDEAKADENQVEALKQIHKFFTGTWLEYAAAAAFYTALDSIDSQRKQNGDESRSSYAIFHNVHVRRITTKDSVRDFELDVVAMLGHQIVVVSCTSDKDVSLIKQKGIEGLHRARQLGGDEARAIVLCRAAFNDAKLVDEELRDETGGASEPLQIWGLDKWSKLTQEFTDYCQGLCW